MAEDMNIEESTSVTEGTVDSVHSTNMILEEEEETVTELDTHWKAVNENPRDFTSWTYLLDYVEKGDDIDNARKAFDQFLSRYPYCYGYWKKFAELERRHHDLERCIEVYERGVKAIPLSVELWTAYLDTALDIYHSSEDYEATIKGIYERAIEAAGLEFRSDKLWEHYISWTTNLGHLNATTKIYDRLLQTTTQMYYQNWENFKKHVEDNETALVIPTEELNERKATVRKIAKTEAPAKKVTNGDDSMEPKAAIDLPNGAEKKEEVEEEEEEEKGKEKEKDEELEAKEKVDEDEEEENGKARKSSIEEEEIEEKVEEKESNEEEEKKETEKEEEEVKEEMNEEKAMKPESTTETPAAELALSPTEWKQVKQQFIEDREKVYQKTYEQITKRWYFEEKIRRPYFHVKPLEKSQLDNWREYLDFEIEQNDAGRISVLFDRCLIACAQYEEFWVRYANYLEAHGKAEHAGSVWRKACTTHLPHCADLHWRWAVFEESQGNSKAAADILTRGQRECSSNVRLCTRRLALLRRAKLATGEALCGEFEAAIERFASENTASASLLSLKYARYLCRIRGDLEKAERVLREAIARDETNERLYLQLVDLNYTHASSQDVTACDRILAWIVSLSVLPRKTRLRFGQRRCELLEESSNDIAQITAAVKSLEELKRESEAAGEGDVESSGKGATSGSDFTPGENTEAPPSKRARTATGGAAGASSSDAYAASAASSYDQQGNYHHYGDGAGAGGDMGAPEGGHGGDSHGHGGGGGAASYAAAAAAAAANAAYPGYSASGGGSWDSYYNSYYGYYAGYYGAAGTEHGGDWQMQNASS